MPTIGEVMHEADILFRHDAGVVGQANHFGGYLVSGILLALGILLLRRK